MATLDLDAIDLPLRAFHLELTLAVTGTLALVGPSGAGKSSVLRCVAGLARPERGRIAIDGEPWFESGRVNVPPEQRRVGLLFQDYALFPHMTVRRNVEFGGKRIAGELLERFRIDKLADAKPGKLSGGERQRVALARALAREPQVLLLDEPLAALDAHTKTIVRAELQELLAGLDLPVLLVTHDFEDAAALADRVGVLVDGSLRQLGSPAELVAEPADAFVASFTGANLLHGRADGTRVHLVDGTVLAVAEPARGDVALAVYPWDVTVGLERPHDSALNVVGGEIRSIATFGSRVRVAIGPISAEITAESLERLGLEVGRPAYASFKATGTRVVAAS
jgi:ABC-type sulfate/molybdate transport systems ATPase subunit